MRTVYIIFVSVVLILACKKREENPVVPFPDAGEVRITQWVDSNTINKTVDRSEQYYYDKDGRVTSIEMPNGQRKVYEYSQGKLSRIIELWNNPEQNSTIDILRDELGLIKSISRRNETNDISYDFTYEAQGNLTSTTETRQSSGGEFPPETTTYSDYDRGHWTKSIHWKTLVFRGDTVRKYKVETHHTYNADERLIFIRTFQSLYDIDSSQGIVKLIPLDLDSTVSIIQYFEMNEAERTQRAIRKQSIKNFYTPNLDVGEFFDMPIIPDYVYSSLEQRKNGGIYKNTTTVLKTNAQAIIVEIQLASRTLQEAPGIPSFYYNTKSMFKYEEIK